MLSHLKILKIYKFQLQRNVTLKYPKIYHHRKEIIQQKYYSWPTPTIQYPYSIFYCLNEFNSVDNIRIFIETILF